MVSVNDYLVYSANPATDDLGGAHAGLAAGIFATIRHSLNRTR